MYILFTNDILISEPTARCIPETCVGISSGTATAISNQDLCTCRCHPHLPAFREDLRICVDDIHGKSSDYLTTTISNVHADV